MRRMLSSFAISLLVAAPSLAIDAVDFDRMFRAASGPSLPEPPAQLPLPKEELTVPPKPSADQNAPAAALPSGNSVPGNTAPANSSPIETTRQLPRDAVDYSVLTEQSPHLSGADGGLVPESIHQSLPSPQLGYQSQNTPAPMAQQAPPDRVDFQSMFASANAPCASAPPPQYYRPAVPICMPDQGCPLALPCTYCGPITGMQPGSFEGYYQSPSCYRNLWATHASERAQECAKHHQHLQTANGCPTCNQHQH